MNTQLDLIKSNLSYLIEHSKKMKVDEVNSRINELKLQLNEYRIKLRNELLRKGELLQECNPNYELLICISTCLALLSIKDSKFMKILELAYKELDTCSYESLES